MSAITGTLSALGWQLHCDLAGSDKYYRLIVVRTPGEKGLCIVGYGRRGSAPQFKGSRQFRSVQAAVDYAVDKVEQKSGRGYYVTCEATEFDLPAEVLAAADRLPAQNQNVPPVLADRVSAAFDPYASRF